MTINDTIQYLRAMEQQISQFGQCETRMRSIQSSINKLKREQMSLRLPPSPTYEIPKETSSFEVGRAFIVCFLCFFTGLAVYGGGGGSSIIVVVVLAFISFILAFIAGKLGEKKRKQEAKAAEVARVRNINQQRAANYDAKKRKIEARRQEIVEQIRQLNADYQKASQAREQARNKATELGKAIRLHSDYWSVYALSHIRGLLEHGRADTLKEALNRYEDEERQREHHEQMENYASAQAAAAEEEAYYRRQQAEYQAEQAEYARQAAGYARQQADNAAATRRAVEDMKWQQDLDRFLGN